MFIGNAVYKLKKRLKIRSNWEIENIALNFVQYDLIKSPVSDLKTFLQ